MSTEPNQDPLARVRQLEREVDELRDRYDRTEGMMNGLLQRGLKDMLVQHGYQTYGAGQQFLTNYGIAVIENTAVAASERRWLTLYPSSTISPADYSPREGVSVFGTYDQTNGVIIQTAFDLEASTFKLNHLLISLEVTQGGVFTPESIGRVNIARGRVSVIGKLRFSNHTTADEAGMSFADGDAFYNADTDVFRGRANGVTETFAFESDVVLLTNANWTDLTDGGATVLHTHAASGGTDPHPFLLMGA